MANGGFEIPVGLDFVQAYKDLDRFSAQVDRAAGSISKSILVDVDTDPAMAAMKRLEATTRDLLDKALPVEVDVEPAKKKIADLERDANGRFKKKHQVDVDTKPAEKKIGGLADLMKSALTFDAIGGLGDFATSISEGGVAARDSLLNLQAQTGATGAQMEVLKGQADDAFRSGVGESVADARKAIATAEQQLGAFLDEDGITAFTTRAAAIGQVFDKDVNEVLAKSRTFISNFGLDGKQAGDLIALTMQKAGTGMDDVLDTLDEYSQLLKEAGFSAEEFSGRLTIGVQAGTRDTDKLADAMKEMQIRLKAGDTTEALSKISSPITASIANIVKLGEQGKKSVADVMTETAAEIEKAFQAGQITDAMRSQLQVAVAGTPAEDIGAEMYSRVFGAKIDPTQIQAQAKLAGEQMQGALGPVNFFEKIGKDLELFASSASEKLAPFTAGFGKIASSVASVGPGIAIVTNQMGGMGKIMATLKGGAGRLSTSLMGALGPAAPWIAGIAAAIGLFVLAYNKSETFRATIDKLVADVSRFAEQLYRQLKPILEQVAEIIGDLASFIIEYVVAAFEAWWSIISTVIGVVFKLIGSMTGASKSAGGFSSILGFVSKALGAVQKGIQFLRAGLAALSAGFATVVRTLSVVIDAIGSGDFLTAAKAFLGIGDAVAASFAQGFEKKMSEIGSRDFSSALTAGMTGSLTAVGEETGKIVGDSVGSGIGSGLIAGTTTAVKEGRKIILDFGNDLAKLQEETTRVLNTLSADVTVDPIDKFFRQQAEKSRLLDKEIQDQIDANQKKIEDARATAGTLDTIEIKQFQETQDQLERLRDARRRAYEVEQTKGIEQLARVQIEEARKAEALVASVRLGLLKQTEELITGETLEEIRERNRTKLSILQETNRQELIDLVEQLAAKELIKIEADRIAKRITDEEAATRSAAAQQRIVDSSKQVQMLIARQIRDEGKLQKDARTVEQIALDKHLRETNALYAASMALQDAIVAGSLGRRDSAREASLQKEVEDLGKQASEVQRLRDRGEISYDEHRQRMQEITRKRMDAEIELASSQLNALTVLNQTASALFGGMATQFTTAVKRSTDAFIAGAGTFSDVLLNSALQFSAITAQAAVDQENIAKAAGNVALQIAFDFLQALAPIWSAQIVAGSTATPQSILTGGIAGIIQAAALLAAMNGAIALARNYARFEHGGLVQGGEQFIRINEKGREFVTDHRSTKTNLEYLLWQNRNKGRPVEDYILHKYGRAMKAGTTSPVATEATVAKAITDGNAEIVDRLEKMEKTMDKVSKTFESSTTVKMKPAKMTLRGRDLEASIEQTRTTNQYLGG